MKKTFLLSMIVVFCACSNETGDKNNDAGATEANAEVEKRREDSLAAAAANTAAADREKGIELIAQSDCLTCHKVDEKLVGPPYREVAQKYNLDDTTRNRLAEKIIKGGVGVWGNIPMPPHPQISEGDAKSMVNYILSLKQQQ
jgi:cytochrome c